MNIFFKKGPNLACNVSCVFNNSKTVFVSVELQRAAMKLAFFSQRERSGIVVAGVRRVGYSKVWLNLSRSPNISVTS